MARSLGAKVKSLVDSTTTHLVAARLGTAKVFTDFSSFFLKIKLTIRRNLVKTLFRSMTPKLSPRSVATFTS